MRPKNEDELTPLQGHRQRLRERFLASEGQPLDETQALELLLTYAIPRQDVRPTVDALLARFGSLAEVLAAGSEDLKGIPGVGDASVLLIKLVRRLVAASSSLSPQPGTEPVETSPAYAAPAKELIQPPSTAIGTLTRGQSLTERKKTDKRSSLFTQRQPSHKKSRAESSKRTRSGLFGKGLLKEAIACLPRMPDSESLEDFRLFLRNGGLHHSSERTRQRFASYIIARLFPKGSVDRAIRSFSRQFAEQQALRDVCFYRFLKAEPFLEQVMTDLVVPAASAGTLARTKLRDYVAAQFPTAKPNALKSCSQATVDIIQAAKLGLVSRTRVSVVYRDVSLEAFAFVLHSEFSEPDMYQVSRVERGSAFRAMLWRPDGLLPALYELRNRGWISKVSEIDSVRQFTTRYNLDQVVDRITAEGGRR